MCKPESIPVIYELDSDGEATGDVHFFCCVGCRSQSSLAAPSDPLLTPGDCPAWCVPDGSKCETCGGPVFTPFTGTTLA